MGKKHSWIIWVSGYGEFEFTGTEKAAEKLRSHKAIWEQAVALKWLQGKKSPIIAPGKIDLRILREGNLNS